MDKSILTRLIILLFAITIFSTLLNSCNSKEQSSVGKMFSGKAISKHLIEEQTLIVNSITLDTIAGTSVSYNAIINATKRAHDKGYFDIIQYEKYIIDQIY